MEENLCLPFCKNLKIPNGRHFWEGEIFLQIARSTFLDTMWVKNFNEITLSCMVKEIEANLSFAIFGKNLKIHPQWGGHNQCNFLTYNFL